LVAGSDEIGGGGEEGLYKGCAGVVEVA
jgi:hypothetical protein